MKKISTVILVMMVLMSTASAFNSNALKKSVQVTVINPQGIVNPNVVVNAKTRFKLEKFDVSSVSFNKMLSMAGNKTAGQISLYDTIISHKISRPAATERRKALEDARKSNK